jgi:protein phosphatase
MRLTNIYYLNEIGSKKNQEDYIWPQPGKATLQDKIFIVCDGVGGSENGELASMIVAESLANSLETALHSELLIGTVDEIVSEAKDNLVDYVISQGLNTDMATTFSFLAFLPNKAFAAWCGDSRIYQIRDGKTIYKTLDHSLVNTLVKKGEITEEDARSHPQKNIILKAVKADDTPVEYEYHWIEDVKDDDYFLLCTDGLLENIDDKELNKLLEANNEQGTDIIPSFQRLCKDKTRDNYSMYLIQVGDGFEKKKVKTSKYLIGILLLLFMSMIGFVYFTRDPSQRLSPGIKSPDSTVPFTSPANLSVPITGDSGLDIEIVKSDEKMDTLVPKASLTIIQPVETSKQIKDTSSLPGKDTAMRNKNKSNGISEQSKTDSSKRARPSN